MKDLIIIGAGGFGREVAWLVERINSVNPTWNLLGYLDDNQDIRSNNINSYPVLGCVDDFTKYDGAYFVCAIGSSKTREKIITHIKQTKGSIKFATLIDPSVICSSTVKIDEGSIICAGSILTVNITIGKYVIINLDCTIGHDATINSYTTLYPSTNVSGNVIIEKDCEIGTSVQIKQGISIQENCKIGAGAVVVKNIQEPGIYVGLPAVKK